MTPPSLRATAALVLLLCGACRPDPVAGALVINDTDTPITFAIADGRSPYGPWTADPGADNMAIGPPGRADLTITFADGTTRTLPVDFALDHIVIVAARPDTCLALVNYTRQYGGDGQVEILALTGPGRLGAVEYLQGSYLGPNAKLPIRRVDDHRCVERFTPIPCELRDDEDKLARHLYSLD